ncbi:MAG: BON domain-containing protein [Ktedonobacterales bacterium]
METAATEFAEVKKVRLGARVDASDGDAGKVAEMVADAGGRRVIAVGIKLGFWGSGGTFSVPMGLVAAGESESLTITIPLDEIRRRYAAAPDGVRLTGGTSVVAGGRTLGRLTQVTVHSETLTLRHLVIARGMGREYVVPARAVTGISANAIQVDLGMVKPDALAPYRTDADLREDVYQAINNYDPLRIDLPGIEIHAIDGVVWLKGHVSSELNVRLAADQLGNITGLSELHNELIEDSDLAARISHALALDPRTAKEYIGVYPQLGVVRLRGAVRTPEAWQAATEIASSAGGIKTLVNELKVDPSADVVPVLSGVTNEEDMVPGGR